MVISVEILWSGIGLILVAVAIFILFQLAGVLEKRSNNAVRIEEERTRQSTLQKETEEIRSRNPHLHS